MAGSRYFSTWPDRFTGSNLAWTNATVHSLLTSTASATTGMNFTGGSATDTTVPYTMMAGTSRTINWSPGNYVIANRRLQINDLSTFNMFGTGIGPFLTVAGVHFYFINCDITFGTTAAPMTGTTDGTSLFLMPLYKGGNAEYLAERVNGAARIGSNGASGTSSTLNFINCSITANLNAPTAVEAWICATDLIHTNVTFKGTTAATTNAGVVMLSGANLWGSQLDCSGITGNGLARSSTNSLSVPSFSAAGYNALTNSPNLNTGLQPLTLTGAAYSAQASNSSVNQTNYPYSNNISVFTGINFSAPATAGTVVADGTGITGKPELVVIADVNGFPGTAVSIDTANPLAPTMITGTNLANANYAGLFWNSNAGSPNHRLIEMRTYNPRYFTNSNNAAGSLLGNVNVRGTYGYTYGTPVTNAPVQNAIGAGSLATTTYTSASATGRLANTSALDPFTGSASTTLGTTGLRVPYLSYTVTSAGFGTVNNTVRTNWTPTTYSSTIQARHAAAWVGNAAGAESSTAINRGAVISVNPGVPLVSDVVSPFRDEAEAAFRTAANTSNTAIDTYFSALDTANSWNTQNFGNYVAYRWSRYDTNAAAVNYDGSYLNLGAQNVTIDSAAATSFTTATQTWSLKSNVLTANTANGGASTGGITTTGTITLNSAYNIFGTNYAPLVANTITYAAGGTVLQSVRGANMPASVTLTLPTRGVVINTNGDINGITPGVSTNVATGDITIQGDFNYANIVSDTLAYTLGTNSITFSGNHNFYQDVQLSDARGTVTIGNTTSKPSYRNSVLIDGAGPRVINSGNFAADLTIGNSTPVTTITGGGIDINGNRVTVAGPAIHKGTSISLNGITYSGTLTTTTTATGMAVVYTNAVFNGTTLFNLASTSSAVLNSSTGSGAIVCAGGVGTSTLLVIGSTGQCTFTNDITSTATGLTIRGNSSVGQVNAILADSVILGDANGSAVLTNGGSIKNTSRTSNYSIGNLDLTGTLNIGLTTNASLTPKITMRSGAILDITVGSDTGVTIDCQNITFADATATFSRTAGSTGTINLLNWPNGKAIPTGFQANVSTTITINLTNPIASIASIKIAEAYVDGTAITLGTPQLSNSNSTLTYPVVSKSLASTLQFVAFIDSNKPVAGQATGSTLNLLAAGESFVDFNPVGVVPSNYAVITTTSSVTYTANAGTTVNPSVLLIQWPNATSFNPGTLIWARNVLRRILENSNVNTVAWRKAMAQGTAPLPQTIFDFTANGTIYKTGTSAGSWLPTATVNGYRDAVNSGTSAKWQLWNTLADGNTEASWDGTVTDANRRIVYGIYPAGAQTQLTSGDLSNIASAVTNGSKAAFNAIGQLLVKIGLKIPGSWANL